MYIIRIYIFLCFLEVKVYEFLNINILYKKIINKNIVEIGNINIFRMIVIGWIFYLLV